ncbi:MAG TPA: SH3 domain-containing protein [Polyangia bacterium]|nr:SH3 domain-containing protein [Polyangia bacterium]
MSRRGLLSAVAAVAAVVLGVAGPARADRRDEAWRRGNEAYLHGDYAAAAAAYEELEHQGAVSADLFFNLGDAYFRKGALGPAIWAFEKAAALAPGDEDARYNLAEARKVAARQAHDRLEGEDRDPLWIRAVAALGPSTETWLFVAAYLGFFLGFFGLVVVRWRARDDLRPALGAGVAVLGAAALLAGALLFGRTRLEKLPFGVVLPDAVAVKDGADDSYRTSFEIHAGLRVRLIEHDQDWLRVRLGNGLEGWVHAAQVGSL